MLTEKNNQLDSSAIRQKLQEKGPESLTVDEGIHLVMEEGPEINDKTKYNQTKKILENELHGIKEESGTQTDNVSNWDPVLISMVRRTMPTLIANDIVGVQPMNGPTGLIFAMKAWYGGDADASGANEAFTSTEPDQTHTGMYDTNPAENLGADEAVNTADSPNSTEDPVFETNPWPEMSFSIEKQSVTAQTRALKAKYTHELAQDLKTIHGLDAENELANILSAEITAEINREIVKIVHDQSKTGAQNASSAGTFDLSVDSDGRWSVEKYKGLLVQINKEANQVARETRRGVANFIITSADVAGALDMAGGIDTSFNPGSLTVDSVGVTYAGVLAGRYKVYIDPYANNDYVIVGYKGSNPYDAGYFYAPYVPLQFMRATDSDSFQPNIGFKTRYGMTHNPFVSGSNGGNTYYRKFTVANL